MSCVSPERSKLLHGAKPHVLADGTHAAVIKIRLRDPWDRPVAGRQAEIIADVNTVQITQPGITDDEGLALAYVRSTTPGPVNITARVLPLQG
jgi:hypothetical protein